ncbi:uncharacterized protein [Epargyreus clarus]|uniref:uncharacterized protein n=1 Tax=Epargyreus clarus TaxID=520877 RepID=UPI003C2F9AE7
MFDLKDKVVLVTGGADGIGASAVRAFLDEGIKHVTILDISEQIGIAFEEELNKKYGNKVLFITCDISQEDQLLNAFKTVIKEQGYIDVIINNAGIFNDKIYARQIDINLTALTRSTLQAWELMRKDAGGRGGTVINISSISAVINFNVAPAYSATKAAVLKFSTSLGDEPHYLRTGVRIITICFGVTITKLVERSGIHSFDRVIAEKTPVALNKLNPQTAEQAARGLVEAYKEGNSGSVWWVSSGKPALDITDKYKQSTELFNEFLQSHTLLRTNLFIRLYDLILNKNSANRAMYTLLDKVVIVTGGANGIGEAVVRDLMEQGTKFVAVLDVDAISGIALEEELSNKHGRNKIKFFECDVTSEENLSNAYKTVIRDNGCIDLVVNNAAVDNEDYDSFKNLIEINYTAVVSSTLKALQAMRTDEGGKGGTVINVSSIIALCQESPCLFVYAGSKSAILQFSNCIGRQEYFSKTGVRVITVCFGLTDTELPEKGKSFDIDITRQMKALLQDFEKYGQKQSPKMASKGIIEAYQKGESGSTWLVNNNKVSNITSKVNEAYGILSNAMCE